MINSGHTINFTFPHSSFSRGLVFRHYTSDPSPSIIIILTPETSEFSSFSLFDGVVLFHLFLDCVPSLLVGNGLLVFPALFADLGSPLISC